MEFKKHEESSEARENKSNDTRSDLKSIQQLTILEYDNSAGFICDATTGICGPATQKNENQKEEEK